MSFSNLKKSITSERSFGKMQRYVKLPVCVFGDRSSCYGRNIEESREMSYIPSVHAAERKQNSNLHKRQLSRFVSVLQAQNIPRLEVFLNGDFDLNSESVDGLTALFQAVR